MDPEGFVRFMRVQKEGPDYKGVEHEMGFREDGSSSLVCTVYDADEWDLNQVKTRRPVSVISEAQDVESGGSSIRYDSLDSDGANTRECMRYDLMPLAAPVETRDGFIRSQGMITRAGVFRYKRKDGTEVRELRPPEAVFHPDSIRSFSGMPLTLDHPPDNLNPSTVAEHQAGNISSPTRVQNHLRADIVILRKDAIDAAMNGGKNQLSCGYRCRVLDHGGVYIDADGSEERFDAVQSAIGGNHVALCSIGRAGSSVGIRIDDAYSEIETAKERSDMKKEKIIVNGFTMEVEPDVAAAYRADQAKKADEAAKKADEKDAPADAGSERALAESQVANDTLRGENAALKAQLDTKKDDKARQGSAEERQRTVELVALASGVLDKPIAEVVKMDNIEIMKAVILKKEPETKLDGESEEYVRAYFKAVQALRVDTADVLQQAVNRSRKPEGRNNGGGNDRASRADAARQRMVNYDNNRHKSTAQLEREKLLAEQRS